jgi:hypothetical protein
MCNYQCSMKVLKVQVCDATADATSYISLAHKNSLQKILTELQVFLFAHQHYHLK